MGLATTLFQPNSTTYYHSLQGLVRYTRNITKQAMDLHCGFTDAAVAHASTAYTILAVQTLCNAAHNIPATPGIAVLTTMLRYAAASGSLLGEKAHASPVITCYTNVHYEN